MNLYENAFGYTTLRLLVYITLITEAILMIPTTMYIFNKDFVIYKSYLGIILVAYLFVNFINIDYLVARKNVDRFYNTNKVDVEYLQNGGTDNIDVLVELYGKLEEGEDKHYLGIYLADIKRELNEKKSIFEFNYSKYKAKKALEGINIPNSELIEDYHER